MSVLILSEKEARVILPQVVLPADVVNEHGNSGLAQMIQWFTRHRGEQKTYANHSGIIGTHQNVVEALVRVKSSPIKSWPFPKQFEIWRNDNLTALERVNIAREAQSFVGQLYGPLKIVPHAIDGLLGKFFGKNVYCFRRLVFINKFPICSWLVSWSYNFVLKYLFGVPSDQASPDAIHDHITANQPPWRLIARRGLHGLVVCFSESNNAEACN